MSGFAGVGARFVLPNQFSIDAAGIPRVGATLTFYATGTGSLQNTYSDVGMTIPNPNPVTADAAGQFGNVFLVPYPAYRVVLADINGAVIWDMDPVGPAAGAVPGSVPVGGLQIYAGTVPPAGWLFCDGSAISRSVFSGLFAVIGTSFGSGDGATTFNVPDLRGRLPMGKDDMGGVAAARVTGAASGVPATTLGGAGGDQMVATHNHTLTDPGHLHEDAGHTHAFFVELLAQPVVGGTYSGGGNFAFTFPLSDGTGISYASIQDNTTGITIDNYGAGAAQNMPPVQVFNYIIFAG